MKSLKMLAVAAILTFSTAAMAQKTVIVGGEEMFPSKNIVENAVNSGDHTTLVAAVKAGGLVETLMGEGPFTVFAPTNDAFENLPDGTVETLLKEENKDALVNILTYHVVAGKYDLGQIRSTIIKGRGMGELTCVNGDKLYFKMNGKENILIKDEKGGWANMTTKNVYQDNGVIHVVDKVLLPKS